MAGAGAEGDNRDDDGDRAGWYLCAYDGIECGVYASNALRITNASRPGFMVEMVVLVVDRRRCFISR